VETERAAAEKVTDFSDSEPGYIRFAGKSLFRTHAKSGDLVIAIWKSHAKSKRGTVYAAEPLLRRRDNGAVTHLFIEEYADREATSIPFSAFVALWRRFETGRVPTLNSTREVPVELVETLRRSWKK
ncbi:MAG: hypothetical protein ACHREM_22710, partial [Polyangiales bacterium]